MPSRRRIALVLGSNGPRDLDPLQFAELDAQKMGQALASSQCGFEVVTADRSADSFDVRRVLANVTGNCSSKDIVVVYFSGHGVLEHGELFLLWHDTKSTDVVGTSIAAHDIVRSLNLCEASEKLLILDCCHAGQRREYQDLEQRPTCR